MNKKTNLYLPIPEPCRKEELAMSRVGFEPTNPKERFYRPLRLTRLRYRDKMLSSGLRSDFQD